MARPVSRAPCRAVREVAILRRLKDTTDPRARQRLQGEMIQVGQWTAQIRALARRWRCDGIDQEEFEQAGLMGLLEAAARFEGDGEGWPTYATNWIRRRIAELARAQQCIVPETQWEQRTARRQRVQRRPVGWALLVDPGAEPDGPIGTTRGAARYAEVCAAAAEVQAAGEERVQREEQRQALPVALARLPPWARSSLASMTGERAGPLPALAEIREMLRKAALRRLRRELEGV